ncbi:unnamed protein product [Cochlearia groenlandica]
MGHNDNHDHHKILRFIIRPDCVEFLIYDLNNSDDHTWRAIDDFATREWTISWFHRGISLKGNTYFFAQSRQRDTEACLVCFDFTTERFGPRLPLPCASLWYPDDTLSLSSVRDEQLVLLYQSSETLELEIWVTSKIEPGAVSWNTKYSRAFGRSLLGLVCVAVVNALGAVSLGVPIGTHYKSNRWSTDLAKKLRAISHNQNQPLLSQFLLLCGCRLECHYDEWRFWLLPKV